VLRTTTFIALCNKPKPPKHLGLYSGMSFPFNQTPFLLVTPAPASNLQAFISASKSPDKTRKNKSIQDPACCTILPLD
jgi:hypothetical protein